MAELGMSPGICGSSALSCLTVASAVSIPVIASGGAGAMEHFYQALTDGMADAALAATQCQQVSLVRIGTAEPPPYALGQRQVKQ